VKTSPALDIHFPAEESIAARVIARLDDLSPVAIHELGPDDAPIWRAFFKDGRARDNAAEVLASDFGNRVGCASIDIPDEDWAARSQAALRAVRVGRIVVAPPWDVPGGARRQAPGPSHQAPGPRLQAPGSGRALGTDAPDQREAIVIVIQPSMGFGTGHHETTRLCLELLQTIDVVDRDVLDVGTGSGVLALAAALLGARRVRAIDIDQDALGAARENLAINEAALSASGCEIELVTIDIREGVPPADLVLANLTGGLLVSSEAALRAAVRPGGALLVSGFQPHEADDVLRALARDAAHIERRREDDWEAALIRI
jgi:ribosomal protein L11 methyltransferase